MAGIAAKFGRAVGGIIDMVSSASTELEVTGAARSEDRAVV